MRTNWDTVSFLNNFKMSSVKKTDKQLLSLQSWLFKASFEKIFIVILRMLPKNVIILNLLNNLKATNMFILEEKKSAVW